MTSFKKEDTSVAADHLVLDAAARPSNPLIFIPGFRKCGSTTVFDWLVANGLGWGSPNYKEPQFLCGAVVNDDSLSWYRDLFRDAPSNIPMVDGSTLAMADPKGSIKTAKRLFCDLKIVVLIRDPVKRAFSAYWHMKGKNDRSETRTLAEIMAVLPSGAAAADLFAAESVALSYSAKKKAINPQYLSKDYLRREMGGSAPDFDAPDPLWNYRYFGESCYSLPLAQLAIAATADEHKVFIFEELLRSREAQESLVNFVGGTTPVVVPFDKMPASNRGLVQSRVGRLRDMKRFKPIKAVLDRTPKSLKTGFKNMTSNPVPSITPEVYADMRQILASEYDIWRSRGVEVDNLWSMT